MFGTRDTIGIPSFDLADDKELTIIDLVIDGAERARQYVSSGMREEKITRVVRRGMIQSKREKGIYNIRIQGELELDDNELPGEITGRIDIALLFAEWFDNEDAYFGVECKKIDGRSSGAAHSLDKAYVETGVQKFADGRYCGKQDVAMMLGYLLSPPCEDAFDRINSILAAKFGSTAICQASECPLGASSKHEQMLPRTSGRHIRITHVAVNMPEAA